MSGCPICLSCRHGQFDHYDGGDVCVIDGCSCQGFVTAPQPGEAVDLESAERWISDALDEGSANAAWMFVRSGRALIARVRALEVEVERLRCAWNAGRVTISAPDFLEWVAARCMRYEGLDPDGGVELDFAVRLRAMAKAVRAALDGGKSDPEALLSECEQAMCAAVPILLEHECPITATVFADLSVKLRARREGKSALPGRAREGR